MGKRIAFYSLLFLASFSLNDAYSGKHFVSAFGQMYPGDSAVVDFDRVHARLKRFEEYATDCVSTAPRKNNIVVGAITVIYEDPDAQASPKVARTFYFEANDLEKGRGVIAFESTPKFHEDRIFWKKSGLGMIDGHTHLAFEPSEKKALCVRRLDDFLKRYGGFDNPQSPFNQMQAPLDVLASIPPLPKTTRETLNSFLYHLKATYEKSANMLTHKLLTGTKLSEEEEEILKGTSSTVPLFEHLEVSTDAADFTFSTKDETESILKTLLELSQNQFMIQALKAQSQFRKDVKKAATRFYKDCWHSEQRLCHYLLDRLNDAEGGEAMSDETYSEVSSSTEGEDVEFSEKNQSQKVPVEEKMYGFNWDQIEEVGGDLRPAYIFVHVHSRLQFCEMCEFTLSELFLKLLTKKGRYKIGGILGSYSEPYGPPSSSSEASALAATVPWDRVIHEREQGVPPNFYIKRLNPS